MPVGGLASELDETERSRERDRSHDRSPCASGSAAVAIPPAASGGSDIRVVGEAAEFVAPGN
jgi:hypothetical protein